MYAPVNGAVIDSSRRANQLQRFITTHKITKSVVDNVTFAVDVKLRSRDQTTVKELSRVSWRCLLSPALPFTHGSFFWSQDRRESARRGGKKVFLSACCCKKSTAAPKNWIKKKLTRWRSGEELEGSGCDVTRWEGRGLGDNVHALSLKSMFILCIET